MEKLSSRGMVSSKRHTWTVHAPFVCCGTLGRDPDSLRSVEMRTHRPVPGLQLLAGLEEPVLDVT